MEGKAMMSAAALKYAKPVAVGSRSHVATAEKTAPAAAQKYTATIDARRRHRDIASESWPASSPASAFSTSSACGPTLRMKTTTAAAETTTRSPRSLSEATGERRTTWETNRKERGRLPAAGGMVSQRT